MSHVLCRNCAHTTSLAMVRCPRCGYALPYWRSRRWHLRVRLPRPALGRACPVCGEETDRRRSSLAVKALRLVTFDRCSSRTCRACGWKGIAFHTPRAGVHRHRHRRRNAARE
jgi:hypothetical protein